MSQKLDAKAIKEFQKQISEIEFPKVKSEEAKNICAQIANDIVEMNSRCGKAVIRLEQS